MVGNGMHCVVDGGNVNGGANCGANGGCVNACLAEVIMNIEMARVTAMTMTTMTVQQWQRHRCQHNVANKQQQQRQQPMHVRP